jgi:hypothetical protein
VGETAEVFPGLVVDIAYGRELNAVDIDATALTAYLRDKGWTDQEINETTINFTAKPIPDDTFTGMAKMGEYDSGKKTITVNVFNPVEDESTAIDYIVSQNTSLTLFCYLEYRTIDLEGSSKINDHYKKIAIGVGAFAIGGLGLSLASFPILQNVSEYYGGTVWPGYFAALGGLLTAGYVALSVSHREFEKADHTDPDLPRCLQAAREAPWYIVTIAVR